jgi:hypothetical protein
MKVQTVSVILNKYLDWVVGEVDAGGVTFLPAGFLRIGNHGLES